MTASRIAVQPAAEARPAHEPRPGRQDPGGDRDVLDDAPVQRPRTRAVAAQVERHGRHPGGTAGAGEVEVRLLGGVRAVHDHDPAGRVAGGQEEGVGEPVTDADLRRRLDVDGSHGVA